VADSFRDPADQIRIDALIKGVEGVTSRLVAARRAGEALLAQTEAAKDVRRKGAGATPTPATRPGTFDPVASADKVRAASAATEKHEARITRHLEEQNRELQAAARVRNAALFGGAEEQARRAAATLSTRGAGLPLDPAALASASDRVRAAAIAEDARARIAARRGAPQLQIAQFSESTLQQRAVRHDLRAGQLAGGLDPGAIARQASTIDDLARVQGRAADGAGKLQAAQRSARVETANFTSEISRFNQNANLSQSVYTRNGALTTEFISAAAKGQVTIQELGRQVALTIGKFAGWTLAASATYGVARAVGVLGAGAIQSLDAINKLQRVVGGLDKDKAQGQLRAAAEKFNLPLDQVGEAAFGAGKVFKNQDDVFKGTEAALFAVKVGELDAATATQALTAIINGLGGSADDLGPIFDKINNLTNNFGGNVGQLTVGLSKSVGAFHNAGGGVEYLLSLLQTGARVTSFTATEIGTALARTAERLQQPARRQKVSQLLGISEDDAGDVEKVFETVFQRIREGASRQQVAQFASTIATPQLATRLIPIFNRESLFREIQGQATDQAAAGSSERELKRVKQAATEQLKAIGIAVANLGSVLAQSGALEPMLAFLKVLGLSLHLATDLVGVFAGLPKPLREGIVLLGQLLAARALLKRFDVGGVAGRAFPDAAGNPRNLPFARSPDRLERTHVLQALGTEREFLRERRERGSLEGAAAANEAHSARRRADALLGRGIATLDPDQLEEYNRHVNRANRAAERAADLEADATDARERGVAIQEQERGVRQRTSIFRGRGRQSAQEAAAAEGVGGYRGDTQERSSTTAAVPIITATGSKAVEEGLEKTEKAQEAAKAAVRDTARQSAKTGVSARLLAGVLSSGAGAGQALPAAFKGLAGGLRTLGVGLAAALGPLDVLLLGLFGIYEVVQSGRKQLDDAQKLLQANADPAAMRAAADKELGDRSKTDAALGGFISLVKHTPLGFLPAYKNLRSPDDVADDAARQSKREADRLATAQLGGKELTQTQIRQRLKERMAEAKTGAEKDAAIAAAREEMEHSFLHVVGASKAGRRAEGLTTDMIRQAGATIADGARSLQERLNALQSAEEIADFSLGTQNKIKRRGLTKANAGELAAAARSAREKVALVPDPEGAGKQEVAGYLKQAEELEAQLVDDADARLQSALSAARTPQESARAIDSFLGTMADARAGTVERADDLLGMAQRNRAKRKRLQALQAADKQAEKDARSAVKSPLLTATLGGPIAELGGDKIADPALGKAVNVSARIARRNARITQLGITISNEDKQAEELRAHLGLTKAGFAELRKKLNTNKFELLAAAIDASTQLTQSQTADPLVAARVLGVGLAKKTALLRKELRLHLVTQADMDKAIAEETENLKQIAEGELARSESKRQLATSQFALTNPTEAGVLDRAVTDARAALADARSKGSKVDPARVIDAERTVNEALKARADNARAEAEALIRAQGADAESRTDDEATRAQIRARTARRLERFARTGPEKLQARAETRNARREALQQRISKRADTIDWNLEMERISKEEAISQLQSLTKTRGIATATKRELLRKIKALKEGKDEKDPTAFNLGVGNIKLPTVYDVRRGIAESQAQGRSAPMLTRGDVAMSSSSINAPVTVIVNDPNAAGAVYGAIDKALRTGVRSRLRNAGVR
jgi:hypothetical protein